MAASPYADEALPTPAFASPQPTSPRSVSIFTMTESNDAMRPKSLTCWRSYGMGTWTHMAWTLVIFMGGRVEPGRRPLQPVASAGGRHLPRRGRSLARAAGEVWLERFAREVLPAFAGEPMLR
jgi:hypothetical protein